MNIYRYRPYFSVKRLGSCLLALVMSSAAGLAVSQTAAPTASAIHAIPKPLNTPYLGTLAVEVDLTDLDRKIMQVRQVIPVAAGPLTLL